MIGDPLFSVPLRVPPDSLPPNSRGAPPPRPHLCFQIHGQPDTHFNFISDDCTSVNALYSSVPSDVEVGVNVLVRIGVSAVDALGRCVYIQVSDWVDCLACSFSVSLS